MRPFVTILVAFFSIFVAACGQTSPEQARRLMDGFYADMKSAGWNYQFHPENFENAGMSYMSVEKAGEGEDTFAQLYSDDAVSVVIDGGAVSLVIGSDGVCQYGALCPEFSEQELKKIHRDVSAFIRAKSADAAAG